VEENSSKGDGTFTLNSLSSLTCLLLQVIYIYFARGTWAALEISFRGAEQGRDEGKGGKHIGPVGHINVIQEFQVQTGGRARAWGGAAAPR